jgi:phage FluMu protein Com
MDPLNFTAVRCPYCKYVWAKREEHMPVSCPRCKKRFDYPGNRVELEQVNITADSDSTKKEWLTNANRHSFQYDSLNKISDKVEQK